MEQNIPEHPLILVIDDNPNNIAVVVDCLQAQGFEIITARNGEAGINRARLAKPHIIMLDVMMPGIDGFETCQRLKTDSVTQHIPVLFMTVADDLDNKMRGFAAGGVDYISKPVQVEEVLARVTAHLTIQHTQESLRRSEARYRALVEYSLQGVLVFQDARIVFANPAAIQITGYTMDELLAMSPDDIDAMVYLDDLPMIQRYRAMRLKGEPAPPRYEFRAVRKDGLVRWVESSNVLIEYQGRVAVQMTYLDITERKQAEERMKHINAHLARSAAHMELLTRMSSTLQRAHSSQDVVESSHQFLSDLFSEQSGVLYLPGANTANLKRVAMWGDTSSMPDMLHRETCQALRQTEGERHVVLRENICQGGCPWAMQASDLPCCCVPLTIEGSSPGLLHICHLEGTSAPIHEQQVLLATMAADLIGLALSNIQLREHLRDQSIRDPLTGLYNRRYLNETLPRELQRSMRLQQPLGIMLLDVDHFKRINDTYGHQVGDAVLRMLGSFLHQRTRRGDLVCRYGGEEILLVLPNTALEQATVYAEQLRQSIEELAGDYEGEPLPHFTVSIGVAAVPEHGSAGETLVPAADQALYRAKAEGRNRVCVADANPVVSAQRA
jgi:diguanylate cyclase (GGDEF)-like protein/PAS domain S-box-containing protein